MQKSYRSFFAAHACKWKLDFFTRPYEKIFGLGLLLTKFADKFTYNNSIVNVEVSDRTVYIDVFFLTNFFVDTILLLFTAGMVRMKAGFIRIILGALFGAAWSAAGLVLMRYHRHLWGIMGILTYTVIPFLMVWIVFGKIRWKQRVRTVMMLFAGVWLLGGMIQMLALHTLLGYRLFSGVISNRIIYGGIFLAIAAAFYYVRVEKLEAAYGSGLCQVDLKVGGKTMKLLGLVDTGNRLEDPIFKKAVHVLNKSVVEGALPLPFHFIPYHSLGNENGVIPVVFAESMTVNLNGKIRLYERPEIALYEGDVSSDHEYDILLHSEIIKEKGV